MLELSLYCPGLFGPVVDYSDEFMVEAPGLAGLLSVARLRRTRRRTPYRQFAALFGGPDEHAELPVAAVSRLIDADGSPSGIWLRADPVCLQADQTSLTLIDGGQLSLDQRDALALAAEIRPSLLARDWQLEVPVPARWYIQLPAAADVTTRELHEVMGRDIGAALPAGADAQEWHTLLNELQMAMHQSEVNSERASAGKPPVNSVWFWGLGSLPGVQPRVWTQVFSDDIFVQGLAMLSATPCLQLPPDLRSMLAAEEVAGRVLITLDHCLIPVCYQDLDAWGDRLTVLEQHWFMPMQKALARGRIQKITLAGDGFEAVVERGSLNRFWRRRKPFRIFVKKYRPGESE